MKTKYVFPFALFIALSVVAGVYEAVYSRQVALPATPLEVVATSSVPATQPASAGSAVTHAITKTDVAPTGYTPADVAKHGSAASCWTTINRKVYDLTSWIGQPPGGEEAILSLCGKNGTNAFMSQHGDERRPNNELTGFYIGDMQ
jgi:cytochrome b involved in lipid metabolism